MKKILAILLAFTLAGSLVACGGADSESTAPSESTSTSSSTSVEVPAEPVEPEEPPYTPNPLTGLENDGSYPDGTRFAAVMVNNISGSGTQNARPQWGLSDADILTEIKVEGGITRFMALFSDYANMPQVGPIRSARDQFFQLILPFQPLYVHIGESTVQKEMREAFEYGDLDINLDKYGFERDAARKSTGVALEHTAYTTGEQIAKIVDKYDIDDARDYGSTLLNFVNYNEPNRVLTGDDAVKIDIVHSDSYKTYFNWDADSARYMMSQYSSVLGVHKTVDANNNEQLGFENVLVLFADIHTNPLYVNEHYDIQQVSYNLGGVGYYFNGGKTEMIRWQKGSPHEVLRILDGEGNETPVQLNPGKTYIGVVSLGETAEKFSYATSFDAVA